MADIREYVELGIVHFMMYPKSLGDDNYMLASLKTLLEDKEFDFVEVKGANDKEIIESMKIALNSAKMNAKYCAHPRIFSQSLDPNSMNESERSRGILGIKQAIDEAIALGITDIGMPSGPTTQDSSDLSQSLAHLKKSLIELCDYANSKGAHIFLEPFDTKIDKCRLVGDSDMAAELAHDVMKVCDNFNLMVDLSHIPLLGENIEDCITTLAPYIGHAHVGNCYMTDKSNPAYGDRHPPYDYPGTEIGEDEIARYLQALIAVGYINKNEKKSSLAFEIMPVNPDQSEAALVNAKQTLQRAWRKLKY